MRERNLSICKSKYSVQKNCQMTPQPKPTLLDQTQWQTSRIPQFRSLVVFLWTHPQVEDLHTFSGPWWRPGCILSAPKEPGKHKQKPKHYLQIHIQHSFNHLSNQDYFVYLYFCFIWAFVGVLYFTALLFSLSVSLHDSTQESAFILH